jgi:hypothetical protein
VCSQGGQSVLELSSHERLQLRPQESLAVYVVSFGENAYVQSGALGHRE